MGICILALWGSILILTLTTPTMMSNPVLKQYGVFYMFAAFSLLGAIFCAVFIKETKGLTDIEKKDLFKP
jgi:hypothetical protein